MKENIDLFFEKDLEPAEREALASIIRKLKRVCFTNGKDEENLSLTVYPRLLVSDNKDWIAYDSEMFVNQIHFRFESILDEDKPKTTCKREPVHYISYPQSRRSERVTYRPRIARYAKYSDYARLFWPSRDTAKKALEELREVIDLYGFATVADLFDIAEMTGESTKAEEDENYGWRDLTNAKVYHYFLYDEKRCVYVLSLPLPVDIGRRVNNHDYER